MRIVDWSLYFVLTGLEVAWTANPGLRRLAIRSPAPSWALFERVALSGLREKTAESQNRRLPSPARAPHLKFPLRESRRDDSPKYSPGRSGQRTASQRSPGSAAQPPSSPERTAVQLRTSAPRQPADVTWVVDAGWIHSRCKKVEVAARRLSPRPGGVPHPLGVVQAGKTPG